MSDPTQSSQVKIDYSREELIEICEQAIVPEADWRNRDSPDSQRKVGEAWGYLKAGCEFTVMFRRDTSSRSHGCFTDDQTIWIEVTHKTFNSFEYGDNHDDFETYYLPTPARLESAAGRDWY